MVRSIAVRFAAFAFALVTLVFSAEAAVNPHNLSGCSACHPITPKFGVDFRHSITFTTSADDPGLCAPCHPEGKHLHPVLVDAGSGPTGARVSAYLPAGVTATFSGKVVCTSCHFIHSSDTRYGLLRGFPGSADPRYFESVAAFCEECHGANLAPRSAHGGGEGSCVYCHAGRPLPEPREEEAPSSFRERCEVCHRGLSDDHFAKISPFGKRRECLLCHSRHGAAADSPGLLSKGYRAAASESVVIRPHFRRSLCFACHENTDDYALRSDDVNALCDRCHASGKILPNIHPLRTVPPTITVPSGWPLNNGALTCLTCHDQGHEDQEQRRWMLHGGPYETPRAACRNCHAADLQNSRLHEEINEGKSCEMCHRTRPEPGKDTVTTASFIADPDLLCLRCHDQNDADGTVHHTKEMMGREIEDGHLPVGLPLFKGRVICATCHNPHLLEATEFRLRESIGVSTFCISCHRS